MDAGTGKLDAEPADGREASDAAEVPRRTWLAAERTWLAWWRTGLGAAAVAIAIGRFAPGLSRGERWPFRVIGVGYGTLAVAVLLLGAWRQRRTAEALRRGGYAEISSPVVMGLTVAAVVLSLAAVALVASRF